MHDARAEVRAEELCSDRREFLYSDEVLWIGSFQHLWISLSHKLILIILLRHIKRGTLTAAVLLAYGFLGTCVVSMF
jgi:hypothetical protein